MSLLQKAKGKASEVAREAADASARAADAVAARAHDPETQERLKSGLATAGRTAADASARAADASARAADAISARAHDHETQERLKSGLATAGRTAADASARAAGASAKAAEASVKAAGAAAAKVQDPATQAKVKQGLATARRGARTMVERIDPGILADIVIKATALQERANARLRRKGSIYRIGEIQVTASLPPGISFSIERIGDADHEATGGGPLLSSTELLAQGRAAQADAIVSLDTNEQAAIAEGLADAAVSMDGAVEALEGATPGTSRTPGEAAVD